MEQLVDVWEHSINLKHDAALIQRQERLCNSVNAVEAGKLSMPAQSSHARRQFKLHKPPRLAGIVGPGNLTNSVRFEPMSAKNFVVSTSRKDSAKLRCFHHRTVPTQGSRS